jgi:hypothetical protein
MVDMIGERIKNSNVTNINPTNKIFPDCFIGLSGPYDISKHFDFEAMRGVEQISPMKGKCSHS